MNPMMITIIAVFIPLSALEQWVFIKNNLVTQMVVFWLVASCYILALRQHLEEHQGWRWRQCVPPKHWHTDIMLHSATTQKTTTCIHTSTSTTNLNNLLSVYSAKSFEKCDFADLLSCCRIRRDFKSSNCSELV